MSTQFLALVAKLKEIFQIDRPDLDFGVYRILNARSKEIEEFLNQRLKKKVETSLQESAQSLDQNVLKDLEDELRDEYGKRAFDESGELVDTEALNSHVGKKYLALKNSGANQYADESQVYNHLLTFFSRYYDEGDFISQRRYKGDTYAIPYSGEEVMLHWANKDQYYTKSGEMFSNYRFKLANGKSVLFKLLSADTARENRKDNDKDRRFIIVTEPKSFVCIDENGEEVEETITPFSVHNDELTILFEYQVIKGKVKQEASNTKPEEDCLNKRSELSIVSSDVVPDEFKQELLIKAPTESSPNRTILRKHLISYTQKNTADYFIHKDLGKFLRNELDFYIKNEVIHLDNVISSDDFTQIERQLTIIKCLRQVGLEIIDFLASLEDFQKKLWLKKKFVVSSHYCITLDRIDEHFYPAIVANDKQWNEWESLGFKEKTPNWQTLEYLQSQPYMMVNTALFDLSFKAKLLNSMEDIDEQTNGLIIHSDNFQALNLLENKYQEKIKCIYIDPPYNTAASEIIYKNGYKHGSWLSLMENRISHSISYLTDDGLMQVAIDDQEYRYLHLILEESFGRSNFLASISIEHNAKGIPQDHISATHEYLLMYAKNSDKVQTFDFIINGADLDQKYPLSDKNGKYRELPLMRTGSEPLRTDRPYMFFPFLYKDEKLSLIPEDQYKKIYNSKENKFDDTFVGQLKNEYESKGYQFILPKNSKGIFYRWKWGVESCKDGIQEGELVFKNNTIYNKNRVDNTVKPKSLWSNPKYDATSKGTRVLNNLFNIKLFDYPKSIFAVIDALTIGGDCKSLFLDYFAGSGTTAHATIELNREDNGNRKYILVEQGEYFDTVIKPRIQKVVYSKDWKDGKPINADTGISHCLKVMKLESYEDTLNNLELKRSGDQERLFNGLKDNQKDDYLMHYMLNIESKDSLLNIKDFRKPFDYQMNITTDSAGAYEKQKVDLVETFNYLIGLEVQYIDSQLERGYIQVTGKLRNGDKATILWRDCDKIGYEELTELLDKKLKISASDSEYDVIYINGDHTVNNRLITDGEQGGKNLKIRSIEQEFLTRMFEGE